MAKKRMFSKEPWIECFLKTNYLHKKKNMYQIAEILKCTPTSVLNLLRRHEIPLRSKQEAQQNANRPPMSQERRMFYSLIHKGKTVSEQTRNKISNSHIGKRRRDDYEFGGHEKRRGDGYVAVYNPNHPYASKAGYVMKHILVMERSIGKYITRDYVVHHKNGIRDDNRIENLQLMTFKEHAKFHINKRREERKLNCVS